MAEEYRIMKEEKEELEEYRKAVATLAEQSSEERIKLEAKLPGTSAKSTRSHSKEFSSIGVLSKSQQSKILASVVKRKSVDDTADVSKKSKIGISCVVCCEVIFYNKCSFIIDVGEVKPKNNLQCIAVLPGIGCYDGSSDSDASSNSNEEEECTTSNPPQFDLCGRPIQPNTETE